MDVTRESLSEKFSLYSDAELLEEYRSGGLTELASEVAKAELAKRGIDEAKPAPTAAPPPPEREPEEVPEPLIDGDLVMVARLFDATEAEMLRGLLEAEGVPAMVADGHTSRAISFLQTAIGGVRILVPESYLEKAREVLSRCARRLRNRRRDRRGAAFGSAVGRVRYEAATAPHPLSQA
jgi:Putative prokaryotic signal transducing protein